VYPTAGARNLWPFSSPPFELEQNIEDGKPLGVDRQGLGWAFQILPYIEETAAYQITRTEDLEQITMPMYVCPSRRNARTAWSDAYQAIFAFLDYAGAVPCTYKTPERLERYDPTVAVPLSLAGMRQLVSSFYGGEAAVFEPGAPTVPNKTLFDGVIVRCPWSFDHTDTATGKQIGKFLSNVTGLVKPANVTDGTSTTLMIAEKYVRSDNYEGPFAGKNRNSDDRGWCDGFDADIMRSTCFLPLHDADPIGWETAIFGRYFDDDPDTPFAPTNTIQHFGSPHTGGINAVFADGSVHTISYDVDVFVFNSLGTRNGDELVDSDAVN
jgi:prepilin-type processing-associated H-X9-DG protein